MIIYLRKKFYNYTLFLFLIFFLASGIRLIYYHEGLTFGYDQARDMYQAMEIWTKDPIKLIGPQSDTPGLHHGSFYWYLISPIVFFSGGNVWDVRLFLILINCLTIFFIYDLAKSLFGNKKIALLASFMFAISFEATQYARWLSNPSPVILTSTISFWSLKKMIDGKKWAVVPLFISYGLSIQFQLFMIYQIVVFPLIWFVHKGSVWPVISKKILGIALIAFLVSVSNFISAEFRFKFQNTIALWHLLQANTNINAHFSEIMVTILDRLTNVFYVNIWGINLFLAGILGAITLISAVRLINSSHKYKKELLFLILWVVSPVFLQFFNGTEAHYVTLGAGIGVIILTAFFLSNFLKSPLIRWLGLLAIFIILIGNINLILKINKLGEELFKVQNGLNLKDELTLLDWIYSEADGKSFYLNTITNPAFINTTWSYLFNWYGREKYGYMPIWWGETQIEVGGANVVFAKEQDADLHFLIIEPTVGREDITEGVKFLEDSRSKIVKTKKIGTLTVEERQITRKRIFTNQDVFYYILHKTEI